ncbi:MAG: hypothetical protein ABIG89_04390 [Candidatus Woesearchaeota archaeon]
MFKTSKKIKSKKGDISLNMIIIAIIALLVLVIIAAIFTGRLALFNIGVSDCEKVKGAVCDFSCGDGYVEDKVSSCIDHDTKKVNKDMHCCIPQDYSIIEDN